MSTYLTDMKTSVRNLIMDIASTSSDYEVTDALLAEIISDFAIYDFSKDFPQKKKKFYYGVAEADYALPNDWVENFSVIEKIEYPAGNNPASFIETSDFEVYEPDDSHYTISTAAAAATQVTLSTAGEALYFFDGDYVIIADDDASETNRVAADGASGVVTLTTALANTYDATPYIYKPDVIRFISGDPGATESFVVYYTTVHTLTESTITLTTAERAVFKYLSGALYAQRLANKYGYSSDSSIEADSVDYSSKADFWRNMYKDFMKSYLGYRVDEKGADVQAASARGEWDIEFPFGGQHIFHPNKWH